MSLVRSVFADPVMRVRYSSLSALAADPNRVRAILSETKKPAFLSENQLRYARSLYRQYKSHPVSLRCKAESREPTYDEFEELKAHADANRSASHASGSSGGIGSDAGRWDDAETLASRSAAREAQIQKERDERLAVPSDDPLDIAVFGKGSKS